MHPEVVSEQPGRCPECGMKLVPAQLVDEAAGAQGDEDYHDHGGAPGHDYQGHAVGHEQGHAQAGGHGQGAEGIEWEDDMVAVNRLTTPANTRWKLIDRTTAAEGRAIHWRFRVGDQVKIRLVNEMDSDQPKMTQIRWTAGPQSPHSCWRGQRQMSASPSVV